MCPVSVWWQSSVDTSHTLSQLSHDPDTTLPFDRTATQSACHGVDEHQSRGSTGRRRRTEPVCPRSVWTSRPLNTSHTLSLSSRDPDTTWPSGRAATHQTCARRGVGEQSTHGLTGRRCRAERVCPRSVPRHSPLHGFHILSVLSADPDTTRPFGRAATQLTCAPDARTLCLTGRRRARCSCARAASPRTGGAIV